jgi:hypothetical protein
MHSITHVKAFFNCKMKIFLAFYSVFAQFLRDDVIRLPIIHYRPIYPAIITTAANTIISGIQRYRKQHPNMLPIFLCRPEREVGIWVICAILRFARVTPSALFHENERPGIPVFVPILLFAI